MIDLHCHSNASDGSDPPAVVVELAVAAGCSALALTDHDGLGGLAAAKQRADELGIGFVPGCEVSCAFDPGSMHVLCYFIEDAPGPLADELAALRVDRAQRNAELLERLAAIGLPLSWDEVQAEAGSDVVGRPHFAAVLVRHGVVTTINEAFERYLAKGQPGYVGRKDIAANTAIAAAIASGGVAVLAHPLSLGLRLSALGPLLGELARQGLAGLECQYANYDPDTRVQLRDLAARYGLVATGGSDFHGRFKPGLFVGRGRGDLLVEDEVLDELATRRATPR